LERLPTVTARVCDGLLDFVVLALAAWTVVYHACLVAELSVLVALICWGLTLVPAVWLAFNERDAAASIPEPTPGRPWPLRRLALGLGAYAVLVGVSAAVYAFSGSRWSVTWLLLFVAAAAGTVLAWARAGARIQLPVDAARSSTAPGAGALVTIAWAVGLAVFSLLLVRPDADDTHYVHQSTWIAEHGGFPLRDTLFSSQVFPAIFYPPLSSFEALIGAVARTFGFSAPSVTYLLVTPLATGLAVIAMWRLLRTWKAPMVGLALSTTMIFLLTAAQEHRTLGNLFAGRIWQGKIVFLAVLVPLLFVLIQRFAVRPEPREVVLLSAAGAAGVGLTSTATFLVPILALGCLAPLVTRSWKRAAVGFVAVSAYPLGSLAVTVAVGSRRASGDYPVDVVAGEIARAVLGSGLFAFIGLTAALVGTLTVASRRAAAMVSATVLLAVVLFAPPVVALVLEPTGVGRVFWRLVWIVPVAALVGIAATSISAGLRSSALRVLPAVVLSVAMLLWGSPLWDAGVVKAAPSWKRPPGTVSAARRILASAEPGDVVLAPRPIAQSIVIVSGDVTTVSPRVFYTRALKDVPAAHVEERLLLQSLVEPELVAGVEARPQWGRDNEAVDRALRVVGVEVACVDQRRTGSLRLLEAAGYSPTFSVSNLTCLEAPSPS
jgi:hypothetical protein